MEGNVKRVTMVSVASDLVEPQKVTGGLLTLQVVVGRWWSELTLAPFYLYPEVGIELEGIMRYNARVRFNEKKISCEAKGCPGEGCLTAVHVISMRAN